MKREYFKSLILGNKHKKHIEIVYYKNLFNIQCIALENGYKTIKYLYDKKRG